MRKLIGKGTFSKAYQVSETEVELVSTCPAKECYALFSQDNPLAPKIERDFNKENTFKMPLYAKVKAPKKQLNEDAYELYKHIQSVIYSGVNYYDFTKAIEKSMCLSDEQKENINSLASDVCNGMYPENMRFEISPRNISCDDQGNLIMMDCFFDNGKLTKMWQDKNSALLDYLEW